MKLHPRHFVLLAIIIAVFIVNIVRHRRSQTTVMKTTTVTAGPPVQTPAWHAFDDAAALRDKPDEQFAPAMQTLQQQLAASHTAADADLHGCVTWLEFYRQGIHHSAADAQMTARSQRHLDGCSRYHLDTTA